MSKPHIALVCTMHRVNDIRMFHRWTCGLSKLGWRVTHIAPEEGVIPEFPAGAEYVRVPFCGGYLERIRQAGRVVPHLARARPDIILFPDPELFPVLRRFSRRTGTPLVFDRHENFEAPGTLFRYGGLSNAIARAYGYYEWRVAPRIAGVIPVLEEMIPNLHPHTKTYVAHNFPTRDMLELLAGDPAPETPRYTCVNLGAMHVERGLHQQLEVARAMVLDRGRSDFSLCLGGKFPPGALARCKRFVAENRLHEHIRLVESFLPQTEVIEIYRAARVGFSPYLDVEKARITLQNKILEFMGAGLPVITSPSSMNGRVVRDSGCGALLWASETDAICTQLESWLDDPEAARALGRKGREYVLEHLVWESELERVEPWLRALVPRAGR
jgi:glycosyltransferase involved in cell wall biosynthesis